MTTDFDAREKRFEEDIENALLTRGGYIKGNSENFDRKQALETKTLLSFVRETQPKEWKRFCVQYPDDPEGQFIFRFCDVVNKSSKGILDVLRGGFTDRGIKFKVVYWKPETSFNASAAHNYARNVLTCTRQLYYSPSNNNSVDIVLFLNGIPLISMELKCQFTGQSVAQAIEQYKFTRSGPEKIFEFKKRLLVHFAVDLQNVYMTTRLQGKKTYFLPFNQGSAGAGQVGGAGNPLNPDGYQTAYLWEEVLSKDRLLEIVHQYIHVQQETVTDKKTGTKRTKEAMIFPRYHQLDVVTKLLADVKESGAGQNYLIQHSAGSGKSNSIAWLAHRLSGLHSNDDKKIFQSIVVVTDRRILDQQLQNTIGQFEQTAGVIQKVDKDSQQLKEAINSGTGIIITTIQKFPVIYKEVQRGNGNFAIIVDEAHSSQTGQAAQKLKKALGDVESVLREYAEQENKFEDERRDDHDVMLDALASQGRLSNLSFFAFTATPKPKTLQMFGVPQADGRYAAYHTYSMRQAIEEEFILDVLKHYMTYTTYYRIIKNIPDNPELENAAALKAITQYESLHAHNISQKVAVILGHFHNVTLRQMGGEAKAMVVTSSRLHAVRYFAEFKSQIADRKLTDVSILVAFSGEVDDELYPGKDTTLTEEKLNRTPDGESIKEKQLPEYFHGDDFNMLIVADKYQTGFDEPYLHTMFVDKKLSGVKAVQTLSRLNRTMPGKKTTFVLDFINTTADIKAAFEPYYEATILEEGTDPNVIYDIKNTLDEFNVYRPSEIEAFREIFFNSKEQDAVALGRLTAVQKPALDRFMALDGEERQDIFKTTLARFSRIYAFITQVYRLFDADIHAYSIYLKFLHKLLPKGSYTAIDLDGKISLEYYRLEKEAEGSIELEATTEGFRPITGETGSRQEQQSPLEEIINIINEKFGTRFTEMDKVLIQMENDFMQDLTMADFALNNTEEDFKLIYENSFKGIVAKRYTQNEEFFRQMLNDADLLKFVMDRMRPDIYRALRQSTR